MCELILREKKKLYEKAISLAGYEFGESEDEETAIAWTGAGVFVSRFREPEALPREETTKPAARRSLLNYRKDERASRRGLNSTGGMR
jgi:hypothetical protein